MQGFVYNYREKFPKTRGKNPMTMWKPEKLPVITTLAKEFALFDRFFCSHPGPTDPNRMFIHTGATHGNTEAGECKTSA